MDIDNTAKLNRHALRRILITIFCLFIAVGMSVVMLEFYNPSQNNLKALSSVCMDVICIIILIIIIAGFVLDNYGSYRTTRLFALLLLSTIWAVFLDFLNWAFDGALAFENLTFWFTLGSLCMGAILAGLFSLYLYSYMEDAHGLGKMRKAATVCAFLNIVSFVLTFVLAITGTAFEFVDGHYKTGMLYDVVTVIPIISLLFLTGFVMCNVKKVGARDTFAATGYIIFMIIGALIEAMYSIGTTYVSVAIADVFIFVMLQNDVIANEKKNVQKWMKKSNTDELTGLLNRHAYESDLDEFDNNSPGENFVYVSADLNSLKSINDNFGHFAGDEIIVGASDCLKECFGSYGKLYRTGGDEFVALIYADKDKLSKLKIDLGVITQKWKGKHVESLTISCGYVSKKEVNDLTVRQMAILADQRMYKAKAEYYRINGIERRRV